MEEEHIDIPEARRQIGERIIQARRELGMKQVELAELLGVAERTMQAYESGEVVPYRRLKDLERVLNRPMAWFLHGEAAESQRDAQLDELAAELQRNHEELKAILEGNRRRDDLLSEMLELLRTIAEK